MSTTRSALALMSTVIAGCAVMPADSTDVAAPTSMDPAAGDDLADVFGVSDEIDLESRQRSSPQLCHVASTAAGVATGAAVVWLYCATAAPVTGGVTLVCAAPAALVAGVAVGVGVVTKLAVDVQCGGVSLPAGTNVRTREDTELCRNARAKIIEHCKQGRRDGDQRNLECMDGNRCKVTGRQARANALAASACADARKYEMQYCFNGGDQQHQRAVTWAQGIARRCAQCGSR
jgi:hypothetical protein